MRIRYSALMPVLLTAVVLAGGCADVAGQNGEQVVFTVAPDSARA
jgi:hypothetical protein